MDPSIISSYGSITSHSGQSFIPNPNQKRRRIDDDERRRLKSLKSEHARAPSHFASR